jgi:penicillin-binding protein 1C
MKRFVLALSLLAAGSAWSAVPTPAQVKAEYRPSEAMLLDRHGEPIESVRVDMTVRRTRWTALGEISPALGAAVLQAEDQRFMEHGGVDLAAVGQAAWDNLFERGRARGASTITMQLAALLDPALRGDADGRSWRQKWDQALAARELEAGWSKQQILEAYLNLASFRGELQGVGAASRALFGKAPSGLSVAEAAILASLLRAPGAAPKAVARRACALARELAASANCASVQFQALAALGRPAALAVLTPAPQVARKLASDARSMPSTLDGGLQRFALASLRRHLAELAERNVGDGALVVIDNASGELLAYVGNTGGSEVDGVAALRQAGSTLKPFLYELAIERGLVTAASLLDDSPLDVPTGGGLYIPQNYDRQYKGYASVRTSLASSLNIPAVRTLMLAGLDRFYERLHEVGIASLREPADFYGYSLALGSGDVSLLELANAYRTLANRGIWSETSLRPGVRAQGRRVLDERASFIVGDILSDRAARSTTFGLKNELATGFWSAVKTGTSKDMRDNWCVGFSDRFTVGVWVGNFDGRSMWDVSGVSGAAPVWRDVMDYLHAERPSRAPQPPAGVARAQVAYRPAFEAARGEWFVRGTETALVELVPADQRAPMIVYPVAGSIIAIDPDIPDPLQRVMFQAQAGQGMRWRLDKAILGGADAQLPWRPVPGEHRLELVDSGDKTIAVASFEVRGAEQPAAR